MAATTIYIPIYQSDEFIEIPVTELPEEPSAIVSILEAETAPVEVWLNVAVRPRHSAIFLVAINFKFYFI